MIFDKERYKDDNRWTIHFTELQHDEQWNLPNAYVNVLYNYRNQISNIDNIVDAIETGTHTANTTEILCEHFERVFTVEKDIAQNPYGEKNLDVIYRRIKDKHDHVTFLHGDSAAALKDTLLANPDTTFFFFLDAHAYGQTALVSELKAIKKYSNKTDHVILVDDCNELGTGQWPSRAELDVLLLDINPEYIISTIPIIRDIINVGAWLQK